MTHFLRFAWPWLAILLGACVVMLLLPSSGQHAAQTIITSLIVVVGSGVVYFLPTIVGRKKHNAVGIFVLNVLLGWTLLGWVGALVWACTRDKPEIASV